MLEYVEESQPKGTVTRLGHLDNTATGRVYSTPSTAPCLRTETEAKAFLRLFQDGAIPAAIVIPLSRRAEMRSILGPMIDTSRPTLDNFVIAGDIPVTFPDPESEVLSMSCQARDRLLADKDKRTRVPEQVEGLFQTRLRSGSDPGSRNYERVWDQTIGTVGIANLGDFFQRLTREAGSRVFLAPGPMIRGSVGSVNRALKATWPLVDDAASSFDKVGPHFLFHSDFFRNGADETRSRAAFLDAIRREYSIPSPRRVGYVSIKFYQNGHDLSYGASASRLRTNASEFLTNLCHHARGMGAAMIVHNFGTLALGALQSGGDVATFRGDAKPYFIDEFWHRQPKKGKQRRRKSRTRTKYIAPWDPVALCDGVEADFRSSWEKDDLHAFRHAEHVEPEPFWEYSWERKFEYRTRQIIGSLIQVGAEYRRDLAGQIPIGDAVRSRLQRVKELDQVIDYCPSVI